MGIQHPIRRVEILATDAPIQLWMPSKHMGNLLLSLRAIEALLDHFSANPRTLIVDESYLEIVAAAQFPAAVIAFPRKRVAAAGVGGKFRTTREFIGRTRRARPGLCVAVEGDKVSQRFLPLSGCRQSAGPDNRYCRHFNLRLPMDRGNRHIFFDYEAVARGITGRPLAPGYVELTPSRKARDRVAALLSDELPLAGRPFVILHPCATKDYKQWPTAGFAALARHLQSRAVNVVITGAGDFDSITINQLLAELSHPVLSLHNRLTIDELMALMGSALCFVGNDTGPSHLAAACGTPTLALFGPTDEHLWAPLGENVDVLRSPVPCEATCLRRRCSVGYRCMQTLTADTVLQHLDGLL